MEVEFKIFLMSFPCSAPSVVILYQQREQNLKCFDESDETYIKNHRNPSKYRTVVENGKVVVKQIESQKKTDKSSKR